LVREGSHVCDAVIVGVCKCKVRKMKVVK
jgi:hypothetical protein